MISWMIQEIVIEIEIVIETAIETVTEIVTEIEIEIVIQTATEIVHRQVRCGVIYIVVLKMKKMEMAKEGAVMLLLLLVPLTGSIECYVDVG